MLMVNDKYLELGSKNEAKKQIGMVFSVKTLTASFCRKKRWMLLYFNECIVASDRKGNLAYATKLPVKAFKVMSRYTFARK